MTYNTLQQLQALLPTRGLRFSRLLGGYELQPRGEVVALHASPDNRSFWVLTDTLSQWDAQTGRLLRANQLQGLSFATEGKALRVLQKSGLYRLGKNNVPTFSFLKDQTFSAASFSRDTPRVLVYDRARCELLHAAPEQSQRLQSFPNPGERAWLSPDGERMIFARQTTLFALTPNLEKLWSKTLDAKVEGVTFPNDQQLVYSAGGTLGALNLSDGQARWSTRLSDGSLHAPVASQSQHLAVDDGERVFFLSPSGALLQTLSGLHISGRHALTLSPDASWVVVCERARRLTVFELPSGRERFIGSGHASALKDLAWLNADSLLSCADQDQQLRLWSASSGETTSIIELPASSQQNLLTAPDGKSFYMRRDHEVQQHETSSGALLCRYQAPERISQLLLSEDGARLFALAGYKLLSWEVGHEAPRWSVSTKQRERFLGSALGRSRALWTYSADKLSQYESSTGKVKQEYPIQYEHNMRCATLTRDERWVISFVSYLDKKGYYYQDLLRCWRLDDTSKQWEYYLADTTLEQLDLAPGGSWFIAWDTDNGLTLRSTKTGRSFAGLSLDKLNDTLTCFAISPDEEHLAVGTARGVILLFDIEHPNHATPL